MAVDMFLKLDGIEGESRDSTHAKEIDVLAWSWGMSQSGTMHTGGGGGGGKVSVQDISITKYIDSASPHLMKLCCTGAQFASAKLTVRKAGGTPVEYLIIECKEVIITSTASGGSGGQDLLTENITLNFSKFSYSYTPQDQTGKAGTQIPITWNIATGVEKL